MLKMGDTFIQNGLTYVVMGKDGAGRPVSSCKPEDVEKYKRVEEPTSDEPKEEEPTPEENQQEESPAESKQGELPFVEVPNSAPAETKKQSSKKSK